MEFRLRKEGNSDTSHNMVNFCKHCTERNKPCTRGQYYWWHRIIATEERGRQLGFHGLGEEEMGVIFICYTVLFGMIEKFCRRNGSNSSIAM